MKYNHELVSEALTEAKHAPAPNTYLCEMRDKLSTVRGLEFIQWSNTRLWVYRKDQPYCLGWIGYGDFRRGGDGTCRYVIHAHTIENNKYNDHSPQYRMRMSTNMDVAVRLAKKYLRALTPQDVAGIRLSDASNAVNTVSSEAGSHASKLRSEVLDGTDYYGKYNKNSKLIAELKHLLTINHEFVNPEFGTKLQEFFTAQEEVEALKNRSVPMWFVRVHEYLGEQAFIVIDIDGTENLWKAKISPDTRHYTADNLPMEIMEKLSVLNMLSKDEFVDGVGFSAGDGMFYVVR
jgi:hypothetical protein